jgi:hypothetical protein
VYPEAIPIAEIEYIVLVVTKKAYQANKADFVYACWRCLGWYGRQTAGMPVRFNAAALKSVGDESELAFRLYRTLLVAVDYLKDQVGLFVSGDELSRSPAGVATVDMLSWVEFLVQKVQPHLPI